MNDRELLELAAKAAGIGGLFDVDCIRTEIGQGSCGSTCWNPLADDGDALRLAVRLQAINLQWIIANAWQAHDNDEDRRAYVRRAITTYAALAGKAMA